MVCIEQLFANFISTKASLLLLYITSGPAASTLNRLISGGCAMQLLSDLTIGNRIFLEDDEENKATISSSF